MRGQVIVMHNTQTLVLYGVQQVIVLGTEFPELLNVFLLSYLKKDIQAVLVLWFIDFVLYGSDRREGRRGRRRKQLLDDLKEKRGYRKFNEEALDRTLWRTRIIRGYGPVVRQTTYVQMRKWCKDYLRVISSLQKRNAENVCQQKEIN
jgi:hypothetical protein